MRQPSISTRSPIRAGMQEASLFVRVVTPEGTLFEGKAGQVTLPSESGQIEILPNHEATTMLLDDGVVKVGKESFSIGGALFQIEDIWCQLLPARDRSHKILIA